MNQQNIDQQTNADNENIPSDELSSYRNADENISFIGYDFDKMMGPLPTCKETRIAT